MLKDYKPTILIVDDIEANLDYLEAIIKPFNANLIKALSGKEALTKIKETALALAIIDLHMPNMDGFELVSLINEEIETKTVPIIYLTAHYNERSIILEGYKKGAADFIIKPVEKSILQSKIKIFLELDRQRQQITVEKNKLNESVKAHIKTKEELRHRQEQLQNFTIYMEAKEEEEKKKISRKIHDGFGQSLSALKMDVLWLKKTMQQEDKLIDDKIESMVSLIDATVQIARNISKDIRPQMLDDLGLTDTILWELEEFQKRTGIQHDFIIDPPNISIDINLSTSLFRIFLELLTNIYRHAEASLVSVKLQKRKNKIILMVSDNGIGISEEALDNSVSFGIIGVKERAKLWNGKVKIIGKKNIGTFITITIPI